MTKQKDTNFFRSLILHCLNYVPELPKIMKDKRDIKTLIIMQSAINFIRCDYYSWFLVLISHLPEKARQKESLISHLKCITLNDKSEEFLLTCSVMVQIVHFIVMRDGCFRFIDVAASYLSEVYDKKYRELFSDTNEWNEFERYCEASLQNKRQCFREKGVSDKPGMSSNGKNIFVFWDNIEYRILKKSQSLCKLCSRNARDRESKVYAQYLRKRIEMINLRRRAWEIEMWDSIKDPLVARCEKSMIRMNYADRPKESTFCLGCILTKSYPKMLEQSKNSNCKLCRRLDANDNDSEKERKESLSIIKARLDDTLKMKKCSSKMAENDSSVKLNVNGDISEVKIVSCTEIDDHPLQLEKETVSSAVEIVVLNDEDRTLVNKVENSATISFKDTFISRIKAFENIFRWGIIAICRILFSSWLAVLKNFKSDVISLFKLFFYTLGVFRSILFRKTEIEKNGPESEPSAIECFLTLNDDSLVNPTASDHVSRQCVLTVEDGVVENKVKPPNSHPDLIESVCIPVDLERKDQYWRTNAPCASEISVNNSHPDLIESVCTPVDLERKDQDWRTNASCASEISVNNSHPDLIESVCTPVDLERKDQDWRTNAPCASEIFVNKSFQGKFENIPPTKEAIQTISPVQEAMKKPSNFGVKSMATTNSTVKARNPHVSHVILESQPLEDLLDSVQSMLNLLCGTVYLELTFTHETLDLFQYQYCLSCRNKCSKVIYDSINVYKKMYLKIKRIQEEKANAKEVARSPN